MISYSEALRIIGQLPPLQASESLPLEHCCGRILGADVVARVPSPPFTNSSMDGYAIRLAEAKAPLALAGTIYAKPVPQEGLPVVPPGSCTAIMTGGIFPEWADTVVPIEDTEVLADGKVRCTKLPAKGANLRHLGEDLAAGATVMRSGSLLNPERLMVAAAVGWNELPVRVFPKLHILSTGDELIEPGMSLPLGAQYNASKYFLTTSAAALGLAPSSSQTLGDDPRLTRAVVEKILAEDRPALILSTGAVSAGAADFIPQLAAELGFTTHFSQVAVRPGKPIFLASKGPVIWFGLPGNPVSTCTSWHFFVRPLLETWCGIARPKRMTVTIKNEVRKPEHLRCFFRAELNGDHAWVGRRQGSASLAASVTGGAYVDLPEGTARIPLDTRVEAILVP